MTLKTTLLAAASALVLSAGAAAAAPATAESAVNMRAGPGTQYEVIATIPGGAAVDVAGCTGSWCQVSFNGESGFASRSYLSVAEGAPVAVAPGYAYDDTPLYSDDYYDYGYDYGPSFGVFVGPRHRRFHHGGNGNWNGGRVGMWQGNRGWSGNRVGTVQGNTGWRGNRTSTVQSGTTQGSIGGRASVSAPVGMPTGSPGVFRGGAGAFHGGGAPAGGGAPPVGGAHMGGGAIGGGHAGGAIVRH